VIYFEFFRREQLGQTISTFINYLKNLHTLIKSTLNLYCYENETFSKNFEGGSKGRVINGIKLLQQKLQIFYSKKLKQQSGELFKRKMAEAKEMPEYADVEKVINNTDKEVPQYLDDLDERFRTVGVVNVSSDKESSPAQKYVNILDSKFETTQYLMIKLSAQRYLASFDVRAGDSPTLDIKKP